MIDEILESGGDLYQTILPEGNLAFRYRLLSLREYNVFRKLRSNGILNEYECSMRVFERCFLGEASLLSDDMPAGILISIGTLIMWLSGDCDSFTLMEDIDRHRLQNSPNSVYSYMQAAIVTAMPMYTVDELESWNREKFLKIFTIAENVLEKQREGYNRLTLEKVEPGKKKKPAHGIDFEKENRAIRKHQNSIDLEETEAKLTKEQLRKLNQARR